MYALAICGSPHKYGNTAILLGAALEALIRQGWETEICSLAGKQIRGCMACGQCIKRRDGQCAIKTDCLNEEIFPRLFRADAILIGSPTYFAGITSEMKAVIDRAGFVALANGGLLAGKIGAAVVAARRGGPVHVFDTINHFFLTSQMIVPGSLYWNFGIGTVPGEVEKDAEGMANMRDLGAKIAWLGAALAPAMAQFPRVAPTLEDVK